jgi:hypothetical protein
MRVEEFAETLARRLHAELDALIVPARGWMASRPDLGRRIRRRRARQALAAAAAAVAAVAIAAVLASTSSHNTVHRRPPPTAPVRLRRLVSRSFGGNPAPQPAAFLTYGAGQLFAVVYGQSQTPLLRLDPVSLRVTGKLQAGRGVPPTFGGGALWVAGGAGSTQLWRVDPVTLRVIRRIQVGAQITAVAFGDGSVWLTGCVVGTRSGRCPHSRQRLERIDPRSGKVTGSGSLPIASTWVDLAAGRVILASGENSPVFAIDPRTLAIRQTFHVNCDGCQGATGIAVGPDGLYAVSGSRVVRLNLASGRIAAQGPPLPFSSVGALEAAPQSLWLSTETGTFRLDPITLAPTAQVIAENESLDLTGDTEQALVAGGSVYVSYSGGLARYSASVSRP